jgi:uncharacterized membrane protein YqiK
MLILVAGLMVMVGGIAAWVVLCYQSVLPGEALIVSRMNGQPTVLKSGGTLVLPVVHRADRIRLSPHTLRVRLAESNGLICRDNIRADIEVAFTVQVNPVAEDILTVAQSLGCQRASDPTVLSELFTAKFSEALKTVGKHYEFDQLYARRDDFRDRVLETIGRDLNGFVLADAAIDHLEQTDIRHLDPHNIFDAQGIRKITERAAAEAVAAKQAELSKDKTLLDLQREQEAVRRKLH